MDECQPEKAKYRQFSREIRDAESLARRENTFDKSIISNQLPRSLREQSARIKHVNLICMRRRGGGSG